MTYELVFFGEISSILSVKWPGGSAALNVESFVN